MLSIVSDKNRHFNHGAQTVDSFRQEEAGQGYVDFHKDDDGSGSACGCLKTGVMKMPVLIGGYQSSPCD